MNTIRWKHDSDIALVQELDMDIRVCLDTENPKEYTVLGIIY